MEAPELDQQILQANATIDQVKSSVQQAEARILAAGGPKPYLPMEGDAACRAEVAKLLLGADHPAIGAGRVATARPRPAGSRPALRDRPGNRSAGGRCSCPKRPGPTGCTSSPYAGADPPA